MDRTTRVPPTLNGEAATFRKVTAPELRSAKTQQEDRPAPAPDQAGRFASPPRDPAGVSFISERTREGFRAKRSRALESALRCAREATKPGTDEARAVALLRAVARYAEQLSPGVGLEAAR